MSRNFPGQDECSVQTEGPGRTKTGGIKVHVVLRDHSAPQCSWSNGGRKHRGGGSRAGEREGGQKERLGPGSEWSWVVLRHLAPHDGSKPEGNDMV